MCHDTNLLCYTSWNIVHLNALTNHKHAISFFFSLRSRDACSLESIVPPLSPGRTQSLRLLWVTYNIRSLILSQGERGFKGLIETWREAIDVGRLDRNYDEEVLR
ncbi:hypothetical protein P5V15_008461 [Pogonomyrmex californicus]